MRAMLMYFWEGVNDKGRGWRERGYLLSRNSSQTVYDVWAWSFCRALTFFTTAANIDSTSASELHSTNFLDLYTRRKDYLGFIFEFLIASSDKNLHRLKLFLFSIYPSIQVPLHPLLRASLLSLLPFDTSSWID